MYLRQHFIIILSGAWCTANFTQQYEKNLTEEKGNQSTKPEQYKLLIETKWNSTKQGNLWPCLRKQSCKISIKRRRDVVCFCRKHNCARDHCNRTIKEKPKTRSVLMLNKCSETSKKDNILKEDKIQITEISDHEARTSIEFEDASFSNSLDTYKDMLDILESSSGCFFPMMKRKLSAVFCVSRKPTDDCFVIKCPCKRKPNPKEKNRKLHSRRGMRK
uniref:Uncharacterized protein LOC111108565 isoform X2 n=1 Tax=Crassostrea virginica TaxID=6565 RepID=A0A8B8BAR5_CRAVI|nr:uncharacterized protein LOC111108565 isoform X2 [Crassostrea virginica]